MSRKNLEDDLMNSEPNEGKLRLELRKLTNSDSWVSTTHESSTSNSRASTPLSLKSTGGRRGRPPKKHEIPKQNTQSNFNSSKPKSVHKPKKFRMVLEKDDDYEVDYISPDEAESSSSSVCKDTFSVGSLSDTEFTSHGDDDDNDDALSPEPRSSHYWFEEKNSDDEEDEIPSLDLPMSSDDLLLPNNLVLPALGVYEVLRHFRNSLRLSPFLFEDFCAALMSIETTVLLNECHITLLKTLLKEEESYGTLFVPLDQKDAHTVSFYFVDYLTWPEVLRSYVQSSPEFAHVLPIVEEESFPCVEVSKKIKVLEFLTNMFLSSMKIRDELMMDGSIRYDDHCRVCHRLGDLLCCESCPAVYHLACCDPPLQEVPEEEWQCEVCVAHKLNGVSNCEPESEISCQYLRHDPVGVDRFGRKYWFLVRRLFIESEEAIYYYTTYEEFKHVLSKLDHQKYEMVLCEALKDVLEEFPRQAKITEELTNEACWKDDRKTVIEVLKENIRNLIEKEQKATKIAEISFGGIEGKNSQKPSSEKPPASVELDPDKQHDDVGKDKSAKVQTPASESVPVDSNQTLKTTNSSNAANVDSVSSRKSSSSSLAALPVVQTKETAKSSSDTAVSSSSTVVQTSAAAVTSTPAEVTTSTSVTTANRLSFPKTSFIPLSIKVPLTRCDSMIQPKQQPRINQVLKINPKVQLKPTASGSVTTLKNLFVLSKDGVKTPLTIGSDGKLTTGQNQRLIMINPTKPETPAPQSRLSRELKRLQFAGAGPKMHKLSSPQPKKEPEPTLIVNQAPSSTKQQPVSSQSLRKPFRLGEDGGYKQYKNYFVENTLALNKYQHKEEKDKERHVGYKFSLGGPVEFEWGGSLCGSRDDIVHTLRSTLFSLEQQVPLCFMHARWEQYRKMWGRMLVQNDSVKAFAAVLGILEMAIRDNAKKTVWKEGLGQVRMRRLAPDEKEVYEKKKKHKAKIADDAAQRNAVWCKYPLPVKSNLVWKMRGEEYRVTGYGGWMWVSATFRCRNRKPEPKPFTLFKNFNSEKTKADDSMDVDSTPAETLESETRKVVSACDVINISKNLLVRSVAYNKRWNPSKVDKLLRWRILQEKERIQKQETTKKDENESKQKEIDSSPAPADADQTPATVQVATEEKKSAITSSTSPVCDPEISDDDGANIPSEEISGNVNGQSEEGKPSGISSSQSGDIETKTTDGNSDVKKLHSEEVGQLTTDKSKEETNATKEQRVEDVIADDSKMEVSEAADEVEKDVNAQVNDEHFSSDERAPLRSEDASNEVVKDEVKPKPEKQDEMTKQSEEELPKENHVSKSSQQPSSLNIDKHESMQIDDVLHKVTDHEEKEKQQPLVCSDNHDESALTNDKMNENHVKDESSLDLHSNRDSRVCDDVMDDVPNKASDFVKSSVDDVKMEVDANNETEKDSSQASAGHSGQSPSSPDQTLDGPSDTSEPSDLPEPDLDSKVTAKVVTSVSTSTSTSVQEVIGDVVTETVTTTTVTSVKTVSSLKQKQQHSKNIRQSSSSVKQISTTQIDESAGEAMKTTQIYKISRRFRRTETHGVKRETSSVDESSTSVAKTWKLVKSPADSNKKPPGVKMPIPWNFAGSKDGKKSIFRLPHTSVRHMAIRGGLAWYPLGFRHVQKSPTSLELFWPYRCVRPTVGTVWRYKLKNAKTLSSIAHLLRIIWHSMRWEDIVTKPSTDDVIHTICNDDDIVSIELLKRRNIGKSGLHSEYFVRRIVMPATEYDEEIPKSEAYTPSSRSGLRTRSRQMNLRERSKKEVNVVQPKVETLWMPEDQIELWQIRQFDSMIRMQQKAAAAKKEAEAREAARAAAAHKVHFPLANLKQKREAHGADRIDGANIEKLKAEAVKHITISPALLQQAAALHRSQTAYTTQNTAMSKIISLDLSQIGGKLAGLTNQQVHGNLQKLAIKPSSIASPQFVTIKASALPAGGIANTVVSSALGQGTLRAATNAGSLIQGAKVMPKKIVIRPSGVDMITDQKPRHPTIKLAGVVGSSKIQPVASAQLSTKEMLISPKAPMTQQTILPASGKPGSSMQVKLSANQLNDLMKVGPETMVKVSINMADGTPGVGHLQVIPSGSQVVPTQGQQLMQCKVGNEVKRFLLTATSTSKGAQPNKTAEPGFTADSEVSLETPSLRHRLEQLQQRQQELIKPSSSNVHRLMTDKDPLWGGRTQHSEKSHLFDKNAKKEMSDRVKRKYTHSNESKEERQRKNVVQQVVKSLLDRIERKEELEARRRRREEREEMQKRKRESMDMAKSQQRLHSRLLHALLRHEEQLKQDIRKRRNITEKHLTHMVENELHEDQLKRRKASENVVSPSRKTNQVVTKAAANHVLTERNKKEAVKRTSPKKIKRRRSPSPVENVRPEVPVAKKRKMINSSVKLYCICQTPYDDTRFYIGCDLCMNWFHGECVGISERKAKHMDTWVCKDCQQTTPQEELYCLCKTPYDDAQFYIGCDICQDWFHGRCVGISEDQAETIESYTCPRCKKETRYAAREKSLSLKELSDLTKIVRHLQNHKMAWPFLEPVREVDAPGYYKVITRPMDLQTVMKRLQCKYYSKLSDLVGDVSLIFDNCRQYNGPESNVVKCAEIVETVFVGKIRDMRGR